MIHELKLIKTHKRRYDILKEQQAKVGLNQAATVVIELEDIETAIKKLENTLKQILQHLKEKETIYGISVDPSILINIEDIQNYFKE
jgi:hypothetical protein